MATFTPAALKTECQTNPQSLTTADGLTLAAAYAAGEDQACADALNLVRAGYTVRRADIASSEVLEAIDVRDLPATVDYRASWFESATQQVRLRLVNDAGTNTRVLSNFNRILADTNGSQTRLAAVANRDGSRAEVLWGAGTWITDVQVAQSRSA